MLTPYGKRTPLTYVAANCAADTLDRWPGLFMPVQQFRQRGRSSANRIVTPNHALVIEAFPRSGSSFAHRAFSEANPELAHLVATHQHRSSQVIAAHRMDVPVLVLVRAPQEAATSLLALGIQQHQLPPLEGSAAAFCMAETLRRYIRFHKRILRVPGIFIASFEEVTRDFGKITMQINAHYGTKFLPFEHNSTQVNALFARTRQHLSPDSARDQLKLGLARAFEAPALQRLRSQACAIYDLAIIKCNQQEETPAS